MKKEEPFYYHGNPIYRFEDLLRFVEFDVSRGKVPHEKVTETGFDAQLERQIEKVRNRNNRDTSQKSLVNRKDLGGNPHLENLLLLTSIDEFLNEREELRRR